MAPSPSNPSVPRRRLRRVARGVLLAVGGLLACYGAFLLVGLWPMNRGWRPPANGVAIYVVQGPVHTDLVLPIENEHFDWRRLVPAGDFAALINGATHYAIGWGDRGFYLETPTWADLKASTALAAMFWPSGTVVHVTARREPTPSDQATRVVLTGEQYRVLCDAVAESFTGGGAPQRIDFSYHHADAFYQGAGAYHCFCTCNSWAGAKLRAAGVCTPLFTPLPGQAGMYLPASGRAAGQPTGG